MCYGGAEEGTASKHGCIPNRGELRLPSGEPWSLAESLRGAQVKEIRSAKCDSIKHLETAGGGGTALRELR